MSVARVGERAPRADAAAKARGAFAYSSDLVAEAMLHGATLRSPYAAARIRAIDTSAAAALPGVQAVLTADDVPGDLLVGSVVADQPVLAFDEVRHDGEPVAIVAATDARTARHAASLIAVDYEPIAPITTVAAALADGARQVNPFSPNDLRTVTIRTGDPTVAGAHAVEGSYTVAQQDQAFLGPESGLAIPIAGGGVELHIATQWLHVDRDQVAAGLGLDPDQVRLVLAGVGGAFGAREDLSMQLHACLLALRTGRPVRMSYLRSESFVGHVHRHPATLRYVHVADEDGRLVAVRVGFELDGGAYASSSPAVILNAATFACGPYRVPNAEIVGTVAYTNNPPAGAMRGFGAVQVAVAYEAQMDRLAAACGLHPLEIRRRNAMREDDPLPTGQAVHGPNPIHALLDDLEQQPLPEQQPAVGGTFGTTDAGAPSTRRGIGYALGVKNIAFSEGFDDSTAVAVTWHDERRAEVHCAAAEVGQGVVGVQQQMVADMLGVAEVDLIAPDTRIGSAGSASASRLTWMVTGALQEACAALLVRRDAGDPFPLAETRTHRHRPTAPLDPRTGQGDAHLAFAFVAHRAVVDLDSETGMARVVELACAQDVGRAVNPLALEGQLEGGSIQGLGLALSEALELEDGRVVGRSFGDYRIPTIVDAAPVPTLIHQTPDPEAPYGLKGVGEMPSISSTPAILAALRAASGRPVTRAPALPEDLISESP